MQEKPKKSIGDDILEPKLITTIRYKRVKNEMRSLTRILRQKFESNLVENIKTSPNKFWSYVKSKTKTGSKIQPLKKTDGSEAMTAKDTAETLNPFFSSTFRKNDWMTFRLPQMNHF